MMNANVLHQKARQLVNLGGSTWNMVKFAQRLGIKVNFYPGFGNVLGVYTYQVRQRFILLNDQLHGALLRTVVAHEVGHDTLHREIAASKGFNEMGRMFNMKNQTENEANIIAIHILISDEDVLEAYENGYTTYKMGGLFGVDHNLVLIKMQEMNRMGANLYIPDSADACFFKHLSCEPGYDEWDC
ncbi:ImmA/IrrE family metallo-endopeptidase [Mitsuokella sp. oral taxon 131]|uniref:ImmA/IrrE family metallo-endopeptidase n=1 Tax=Mitsuokella sp. oral taxon 131 TaxID=1321780 RepID=UPI0003AE774C|nr:ImmA/IrrE family metallo-endopeptidase [Mitsuokella sp. oral taxon 131]ERL25327.1 putative toxin-antitoxin system, toxin component [Mitsuokella sp. oral taxon 131 str. W9106]